MFLRQSFSGYLVAIFLVSLLSAKHLAAQTVLLGMGREGGDGFGTIMHWHSSADTLGFVYRLKGAAGDYPMYGKPIQATNGKLYFLCAEGGEFDAGVLVELDPLTNNYVARIHFDSTQGSLPMGSLMQAANGKLYGMTSAGGMQNAGVIFEYDIVNATYSKKIDMTLTNGSVPMGGLLEIAPGKLMGVTTEGGSQGLGVLFEYDYLLNIYTKRYDFTTLMGASPMGTPVKDTNGRIYGLAPLGGNTGVGTLWEWNPASLTMTKKQDLNTTLGSYPFGSLYRASNGYYYAMTNAGGLYGGGSIIEFQSASNTLLKRNDLQTSTGRYPFGDLIEGDNNLIYGLTYEGGSFGLGTLFSYHLNTQVYSVHHSFDGVDGQYPQGSLIRAGNGLLYGLSTLGGIRQSGVLFLFDPGTNLLNPLHDMSAARDGAEPRGNLVQASNGKHYGLTYAGGLYNLGVLFEYDFQSKTYIRKLDFDDINGSQPQGSLIQGSDGYLYGLTTYGGDYGGGVLFRYDPVNLSFIKLYDFSASQGRYPMGSLIEASDGKLYGMTREGGTLGFGVIFSFDPFLFSYTRLYNFSATQGTYPSGSLIQATNGKLYGMTPYGGTSGDGVLFEYTPATQTYVKRYDFNASNGRNPMGSLLQATNGKLYGMANLGGTNSLGTLFDYDISTNTLVKRVNLSNTLGSQPRGSLVLAPNGKLYGLMHKGGNLQQGAIGSFNIGTNSFTKHRDLNFQQSGSSPYGSFTQAQPFYAIYTGTLPGSICEGDDLQVPFTVSLNFNSGNQFIAQLSDMNGGFSNPLDIGTLSGTGSGVVTANIPAGLPGGTGYRIRVIGTSPSVLGDDNGINFQIRYPTEFSDTETSCGAYVWYGQTYTQSGIYVHTLVNAQGCDSLHILDLSVLPIDTTQLAVQACDSYAWYGQTYTQSGTYQQLLISQGGCDSVLLLNLLIKQDVSNSHVVSACDAYLWNGTSYTQTGTYSQTFTAANGCDSVHTLYLSITPRDTTLLTVEACVAYTWYGQTYTQSGSYQHILINQGGCDSVLILNLLIKQAVSNSHSVSACDAYPWNGTSYTQTGTYTQTFTAANGCDSVHTLYLSITPRDTTLLSVEACVVYTWYGQTYTQSGTYQHILINQGGCDSVLILNLLIKQAVSNSHVVSACDAYLWNGTNYTQTGTYTQTFTAANGCDSVHTLYLSITPRDTTLLSVEACVVYTWYGQTYTQSGTYQHILINQGGCDSVLLLTLLIKQAVSNSHVVSACDAYPWNGTSYTQTGTYTQTFTAANGCDSVHTLYLSITPRDTTLLSVQACVVYTWYGQTYTQSGTYQHTLINQGGCDSLLLLNLLIKQAVSNSHVVSACDAYPWNGTSYTQTGTYTQTFTAANGCDSVHTLYLSITPRDTTLLSVEACVAYNWYGQTYTQSGTYQHILINQGGCDSVLILNLLIKQAVSNSHSVSACDAYPWNGTSYTQTGTYTQTFMATNGCDSVHTLYLNISPRDTTLLSVEACVVYTWYGQTYTQSGTYQHTLINQGGCDSMLILNLLIKQAVSNSHSASACDAYQWNGTSYTQTGTYTQTFTAANGCDSVHTLYLSITPRDTTLLTVEACVAYSWYGQTYTQSGTYQHTLINQGGCDSMLILNLLIKQAVSNSHSVSACDAYPWNGTSYTQTGTYTQTFMATNGCDSVHTLYLNISPRDTTLLSVEACVVYTWYGQTYTQSGTYQYTLINQGGCDSVLILNLLIKQAVSNSHSVSACDAYQWNGTSYTQTGTYTQTFTAANGCDSVHTLYLNFVAGVQVSLKAFLSGPYDVSTGMMWDSLRVQSWIPLVEPYSSPGVNYIQPVFCASGQTVSAIILAQSGSQAIVDWVVVELRSPFNMNQVVANMRALIRRDGQVVDVDGQSAVQFPGVNPGFYYVALKHRNHLGIMNDQAIWLSACGQAYIDFSLTGGVYNKPGVSNGARRFMGNVWALWSGDANRNKQTKYNGLLNDKEVVANAIGLSNLNQTLTGYRPEDINMDGLIRYNNTNNDRVSILENLGVGNPNTILFQHTPN